MGIKWLKRLVSETRNEESLLVRATSQLRWYLQLKDKEEQTLPRLLAKSSKGSRGKTEYKTYFEIDLIPLLNKSFAKKCG